MSTEATSAPSLFERILAYATVTIIVIALGSFFATLIVGMNDRLAVAEGLWPFVYAVSLWALPIGFVLLMILLALAGRRRSRDARGGKPSKG